MKAVIYITNSDIIIPKEIESAVVFDSEKGDAVRRAFSSLWPTLTWIAFTEPPPEEVAVGPLDPSDPGPEELEQFKAAEAGKQAEGAPPKSSLVIAAGSEKVKPR